MATIESTFRQFEKRINALEDVDQNGESGFAKEFQALRQTSSRYKAKGNTAYATKAGETSVNRPKNRFKDILPFDCSRVKLPSTGEAGSDYINANFVKGVNGENVYIASQGPLPNTVNDFWRMLWTYKVKVVVMLCREEENGKKKCHRYWCDNDEDKLNFGEIVVKTERCIGVGNDFMMRTLVAEMQGEKLTITQFHYTAWPDHGVPTTALPLIHLIKLVREYQPEDNPPIVLHCSAGCGRTGTICALDYTRSLLKQTMYKDLNPYQIVESLRKQRHAMVQTKGQYEFLCRAMCSLFREKLNLPIEEDHDDHLYENVVLVTPSSDSDSDFAPSSSITVDKTSHQTIKTEDTTPPKIQYKSKAGGVSQGSHSGPNQKRQSSPPQLPNKDYDKVAYDLIDLSDETTPSQKPSLSKPNNINLQNVVFGSRNPVTKQTSSPDYVVVDRSRNNSDDADDYVIAPPRGNNHAYKGGSRSLPTHGSGYENVQPVVQTRPATSSRPAISTKPSPPNSAYENVFEASGCRTPIQTSTSPSTDRPRRPATPEKYSQVKELHRSMSSTNEHEPHKPAHVQQPKATTCGPKVGAKFAKKIMAMDGKGARVLPNESMDAAEAEKQFAKELDTPSSLYTAVNKRGSRSFRRQVNEETFKFNRGENVDGQKTLQKKTEVLPPDEQDSNSEPRTKSRNAALTSNWMPFLTKKTEVRGTMLADIGYGKRVGKPKGPRSPPQSWGVRS